LKDAAAYRKHNKPAWRLQESYKSKNPIKGGTFGNAYIEIMKERKAKAEEAHPTIVGKHREHYNSNFITTLHILYNEFRGRPDHLGADEHKDEDYLLKHGNAAAFKLVAEIKETHQDA
jgi:hypothetical protein